jgi:hypothetical protein
VFTQRNLRAAGGFRLAPMLALFACTLVALPLLESSAAQKPAATPRAKAPAPEPVEAQPDLSSSAEVTFPVPQRFAIVSQPQAKARRLYGAGDIVPDPKAAGQGCLVEEVQPERMLVRTPRDQKPVWVPAGGVIPDSGGRRLDTVVLLEGVQYGYASGANTLDPEARLVGIRARRAVLVVDTAATAPRVAATAALTAPLRYLADLEEQPLELSHRLDKSVFAQVQVKPTGQNTYEVSAADARRAFDHTGEVLMEAWSAVQPTISVNQGLSYRIESDVVAGVLGGQGFRVDSPKLAERAGLQTGDVVQSVNGKPISGFVDLFKLYQQMKQDPNVSAVQVNLDRQGQQVTKTYRIR